MTTSKDSSSSLPLLALVVSWDANILSSLKISYTVDITFSKVMIVAFEAFSII
jgi:hypothetical protein